MEIFHNRDRPNYEEVISYGPKWLTGYREMDANYQYAGWTLDLMAYWLERIIHNVFPLYADEETITQLEKFLGLEYDPSLSLETRRKVVAAFYYFGYGKLSKTTIVNLIKAYTGCDSDVAYDGQAFLIEIDGRELPVLIDDKLLSIISRRMPAHLGYAVNIIKEARGKVYAGCGIFAVYHPAAIIDGHEKQHETLQSIFSGIAGVTEYRPTAIIDGHEKQREMSQNTHAGAAGVMEYRPAAIMQA